MILLFSLFNAKRSQLQLRSRFKFIVVGIVDLAFAGLILTGIMLLSRVGIVTDCMREFDEEEENQRIFVLAHKLGYAGSPQEVCQSFEFDWRWLNGLW